MSSQFTPEQEQMYQGLMGLVEESRNRHDAMQSFDAVSSYVGGNIADFVTETPEQTIQALRDLGYVVEVSE